MEDMSGLLDGVGRMYQQLDEKLSPRGGMGTLVGMHRKIRDVLESISIGELENLLGEILRARDVLNRLQEDVLEIRILKEAYSSAALRLSATTQRLS
jgi:hypothetical protein